MKKAQTQRQASTERQKSTQKKSLTQILDNKEDFDQMILDIDIKKPRNAYNYFTRELREKLNLKGSITDKATEFSSKYQKLTESEKAKYEKMAEDDRKRYQEHMTLVRKYVLDKPFKENATPYSIFIDEKLRDAREQGLDLKESKEKFKSLWENDLTPDEKRIYKEKLEKHQQFYQDLRKSPHPPNAYALYIQDQMNKARSNNKSMTFQDAAEKWNNTSDSVKQKYSLYAQEVAEEARKNRHIYEIAYGIKPKLPIGAYRFFYKDMMEQGKIGGVNANKEAKKIWDKLKDSDKDKYLKMAKKEKIAYILKKREYESKNRKGKGPSAYNLFVSDLKGTSQKEYSEQGFLNYAYQKWKTTDKSIKKKYEEKALKLKKEIEEEYEERITKEKTVPKRALSAYNIFVKEKFEVIQKKYPNKEPAEILAIMPEEYNHVSKEEKSYFTKKAKKDKERYESEKSQYEINMSQINDSRIEKIEERKARSKSKIEKDEDSDEKSKSKSRNESKDKNAKSKKKSKKEKEEESEAEESEKESKSNKKRSNSKKSKVTYKKK